MICRQRSVYLPQQKLTRPGHRACMFIIYTVLWKTLTWPPLAAMSMIPWDPPPLEAPDRTLRCVGGTLHCDGMFDAYVRRRETVYKFCVAVIPESPCLLGRSVSEQMGLVQRMDSLECPTPSRKMHMRTDEVNISLKEGHTPYCATTLSEIAIPLMEPCRRELEWMEANGIIEKVTEPTDWCARMVPVP